MLRAQKCAIGAELLWPAKAPSRVGRRAFPPNFLEALAARFQQSAHVLALRVAVENARQQIVDGHVACDGLARKPGDEADQPGARRVGEAELDLGNLHAA